MISRLVVYYSILITANIVAAHTNNEYFVATAVADIFLASNSTASRTFAGSIKFEQYHNEEGVAVTGKLTGILPPGMRGFHIHENPANTACTTLGRHYNPLNVTHGTPNSDSTVRHVGDLGNIESVDGEISVVIIDSLIEIGTGDPVFDIVGKSVAIHAGVDDLGQGAGTSLVNGNAGPIIACGTIVLQTKLLTTATATIYLAGKPDSQAGIVTIRQYVNASTNQPAYTMISGGLSKILPSQLHGFHIHEFKSANPANCSTLGRHYNPLGAPHGPQNATETSRHVGDLGNLMTDDSGSVDIDILDRIVQAGTGDAKLDVIGRSFAVHIGQDDLGMGGTNTSLVNGNAGTVIACGNIEPFSESKSAAFQGLSGPGQLDFDNNNAQPASDDASPDGDSPKRGCANSQT